mgnify:CR=1 FL=1
MDINTNFIAGKMNKSVDERLLPPGQYIDAQNVRLGSTETTEIGAVENSKGNTKVSTLQYNQVSLSQDAKCIGAYADGINQTMYWFVSDPSNGSSGSGKVDMIVSYNASNNATRYIVISETVLNFSLTDLITGVSLINDLLFFTDNVNPPRVININRDYPFPSAGDGITEEDISVIVKPPGFSEYTNSLVLPPVTEYSLPAPTLNLFNTPSEEENYLLDKFLCFAYRYKYKDNQYSATSLFTTPAFEPNDWLLDYDTLENAGMENKFNTVEVTFSTGGSNVIGVDLLYKESGKNTIYLIERYDKINQGWADNTTRSINFGKKKIYTLLGEDELLRTFDNVPKLAQAQTIMGNRVFYGNYVDGHNMLGFDDLPVVPFFTPEVIQIQDKYIQLLQPARTAGTQQWNISATTFNTTLGRVTFYPNLDLNNRPIYLSSSTIQSGTTFEWNISLRTTSTESIPQGLSGFPVTDEYKSSDLSQPIDLTFRFTTTRDYNSINTMLLSAEFSDAVGETNFQPIANSNNGNSLTDLFNTALPAPGPNNPGVVAGAGPFIQTEHTLTGITSATIVEGFKLTVTGDSFTLKVPAVEYTFFDTNTNLTSRYYEYFQYIQTSMTGILDSTPNRLSLHSNRDYNLGIIYMDEYGRSSTVITNEDSAVHISPEGAGTVNRIRVSVDSPPPKWATRYKFAIKPSDTTYETLYITTVTADLNDPTLYWFRLVGQDQNLLTVGDRLIVKSESISGVAFVFPNITTLTVLEIEAKGRGQIDGTVGSPGSSLPGLYFSAKPNGWSPRANSLIVDYPTVTATMKRRSCGTNPSPDDQQTVFPLYFTDSGGVTSNIVIQPGSVIQFTMSIKRGSYGGIWTGDEDDVASVDWAWNREYVSNALYTNFKDWFDGQGISAEINGTRNAGGKEIIGHYVSTTASSQNGCNVQDGCYNYSFQFIEDTGLLSLCMSSGVPRGGPGFDKRPAKMSMHILVVTNNNIITLETEPLPGDPNIYYEGAQNFNIVFDPSVNENIHEGNVQNQVIASSLPAISDLTFANCYSFGNGVESYKIFDNAGENAMSIGERANAVLAQPYQENKRKASITYSGIYNGETNINNSNEFNLSLANFKDLELIFGPIMKLHSRETDILVLQEDRISYVLQGKNLLSDAAGGGAITSIPEVLGKQITRLEEFGISFNPESFASWGKNIYFTDTKRNSVIKLSGGTFEESLTIISESGMRSFFRDSFTAQIDTQKLGGYDPYMGEYVLNNNEVSVKDETPAVACGNIISQTNAADTYEFTVELGPVYGNFNLVYRLTTGSIKITATWQGSNLDTQATGTATSTLVGALADTGANFLNGNVQAGDRITNLTSPIVPSPRTNVLGINSNTELTLVNPNFNFTTGDSYIIQRLVQPVIKTVTVNNQNPSGTLTINKLSLYPTQVTIKVERTGGGTDPLGYELTPQCVTTVAGSLTQIVLTSPQQSGKQLHYEYQWNDITFYSPIDSNLMVGQANPLQSVSAFEQTDGQQSVGLIAYTGSNHLIRSVKKNTDDLDFNINENYLYIFSQGNPMYSPGATGTSFDFDVTKLNGKSPLSITNPQTGVFQAERLNVTMGLSQPNLIAVTDLRDRSYVKMGYDAASSSAACGVVTNCSQVLTSARQNSAFAACQETVITVSRYTNAVSPANLSIGDIMYQNSPCNSTPAGWTPQGYYKVSQGGPNGRVAQIGTDGLVINITDC